MKTLKSILKNETVFCVSFILAAVSAVLIRPDSQYLGYPDYQTLALLFCLMIIIAGFQSAGMFTALGDLLMKKAGGIRTVSIIMVLFCFFGSMVITNDVALLTAVPFTIQFFRPGRNVKRVMKLVVLETIAANVGSMATPIGNPQNLYLYSVSGLSAAQFAEAVLPYAGAALLILAAAVLFERDEPVLTVDLDGQEEVSADGMLWKTLVFVSLLLLCLLVVFRILPYGPVLICVMAAVFVVDRRLYFSVDYFLLLTFVCFFVFVGNVKRIPEISDVLMTAVKGRELLTGIAVSQVISNVPAAILLSGFSGNFAELLTGVNIGGLGTLVASLASLISFKFFAREYPEQNGRYIRTFTIWNLIFLAVLTAMALII